jgi:hypothetical protein
MYAEHDCFFVIQTNPLNKNTKYRPITWPTELNEIICMRATCVRSSEARTEQQQQHRLCAPVASSLQSSCPTAHSEVFKKGLSEH